MSAPALRSVPLQGARYQVLHDTHYRYAMPVSLSRQLAHLWPRECAWQACHERALLIEPGPSRREDGHDAFGNPLSRLASSVPTRRCGSARDCRSKCSPMRRRN